MNLMRILQPRATISEQEVEHGLRMMTREGMLSMGFSSIAGSGFLAAFALVLGANNLQIGILAAIPAIMQPLQIPAILLVEKLRRRKLIATTAWFLAQLLWFPIALIPFFIAVPSAGAISALLALMAVRSILSAVTNCAWNGWVRDLVPQHIMGRFFSRRLALATATAVVFGLGAGFFVDYWRGEVPVDQAVFGYTYAILFGALFLGMLSPVYMARMPEPLMQPVVGAKPSLLHTITLPFHDRNYRKLMQFLLLWGFASNLAIPFFAVYMLQRLGVSLLTVIGLGVLSQIFNILFLRVWGPLADRLGSKAILSICTSLYLLVILGWTFTTMPERYFLTIPLLVILHIFAGVAAAGVSVTVGTIGLKLAPQGRSTPYLAGAALATNLGAGLGPLAGGLFADFFSARELSLDFTWADPAQTFHLGVVNLTGFDFLFAIAFVIGLVTLNVLAALREEGEVGREVVLGELITQTRTMSQAASSVPGLSFVSVFPFSYLRRIPGMDVVAGVTAYQLAEMTRMATVAASEGRRTASRAARTLENGLSRLWKNGAEVSAHGFEIARQAARGVSHGAGEATTKRRRLVSPAIMGIMRAMKKADVKPEDVLRGAGYGVIEGAVEAGGDLKKTAEETVAAAREAAPAMGLDEEEAVAQVVEGAIAAAQAIGPDAVVQVKEGLPAPSVTPSSPDSEEGRSPGAFSG